jgi:hypothetical protein
MIRDRNEAKKAVFFSRICSYAAIVKSVKAPVATSLCSGTFPSRCVPPQLRLF